MGHQFGGNHTFNGNAGNCGTRSAQHAYEVGSGVTIQAYAGICGVENLQPNSIDRFHMESLDEMTAFLTDANGGATPNCGTVTAITNAIPTVSAGADVSIPLGTSFQLTAVGADGDVGDSLTYAWDQFDLGTLSSDVATATTDAGNRALFRSYSQPASPSRYFPSLTYILNNANNPPLTYACAPLGTCLTGETMPTTARAMHFQVVARDNKASGGAIVTDEVIVTTVAGTGPFQVTLDKKAAKLGYTGGSQLTVTWDVAGTTAAPISAANVTIRVSTDSFATFTELLASTPNDGTQAVTLPNITTTTARIMVMAVGNVFFDVSDQDFNITAAVTPTPTPTPTPGSCLTVMPGPTWTCVNGGWLPPGYPTPTPTPTATPAPTPTPTPLPCLSVLPEGPNWVCNTVTGGWNWSNAVRSSCTTAKPDGENWTCKDGKWLQKKESGGGEVRQVLARLSSADVVATGHDAAFRAQPSAVSELSRNQERPRAN